MIRAESDLHVSAGPEEVFDRLADLRNELHWNPVTVGMQKTSEGEIGTGTRFDGSMKRVGAMHMTITEYDRPRRIAMRGGSGSADVDFAATFEADGDGTRLRTDMRLAPKGVAKVFTPLLVRQVPKQEAASMRAFKRWVESGAAEER